MPMSCLRANTSPNRCYWSCSAPTSAYLDHATVLDSACVLWIDLLILICIKICSMSWIDRKQSKIRCSEAVSTPVKWYNLFVITTFWDKATARLAVKSDLSDLNQKIFGYLGSPLNWTFRNMNKTTHLNLTTHQNSCIVIRFDSHSKQSCIFFLRVNVIVIVNPSVDTIAWK